MKGTTPPGAASQAEAARWVRGMFGRVARRYDLLNHLLSFNVDRRWRVSTVRTLAGMIGRPGARVLDLCCGTGDLAVALEALPGARVLAGDFSHPMLVEARRKFAARGLRTAVFEADALALPVAGEALDCVAMAFGFRNLADYDVGLAEVRRVLRSGGVAAILEFSQPQNRLIAAFYGIYSRWVLPAVGGLISGSREAYTYLPESVRKFPSADELAERMRAAGFEEVRFRRMTFGVVALHVGKRAG